MMPFVEYEDNNLPFCDLPYALKRRIIQLSSLSDSFKIGIACPEMQTLNRRRRECFHKVFITDNEIACKLAKQELYILYDFDDRWIRYLTDGPLTIDPTWQSVLLVDEIVANNEPFVVDDTLVLYFTSDESYERLAPLMVRSYSRLVLYGQFTWAQIRYLVHNNVKKVRIMGNVEVKGTEYDEVIKFVLRFARDTEYQFSFRNDSFRPALMNELYEACNSHETFLLVTSEHHPLVHFINKESRSANSFKLRLTFLSSFFVWILAALSLDYYTYKDEPLPPFIFQCVWIMLISVFILFFVSGLIFNGLSDKFLADVKLHASVLKSL